MISTSITESSEEVNPTNSQPAGAARYLFGLLAPILPAGAAEHLRVWPESSITGQTTLHIVLPKASRCHIIGKGGGMFQALTRILKSYSLNNNLQVSALLYDGDYQEALEHHEANGSKT